MSSAATGSLGALLMIAPLAAIPVLAIVGMPRFSSMVAAPGEQEYYEIDPAAETETPALAKLATGRDRGSASRETTASEIPPKSGQSAVTKSRRLAGARDTRRTSPAAAADPTEESLEGFEPGLVWPRPQAAPETNPTTPAVADLFADPEAPEGTQNGTPESDRERWLEVGRRLRNLGIRQHTLSPNTDAAGRLRFVFTCLVAQAGEPAHRFSASGATAVEAMEATLDRVAQTLGDR